MWRQNETLRRNALGNFEMLLKEISRDPAMMVYLDLVQSLKKHPNENWAREVMELFTLGIGNYSEQPIFENRLAPSPATGSTLRNQQFRLRRRRSTTPGREKLSWDASGDFSGDDILDLIVAATGLPGVDRAQTLALFRRGRTAARRWSPRWPMRSGRMTSNCDPVLRDIFQLRGILFRASDSFADQEPGPIARPDVANSSRPTFRRSRIAQSALRQLGQVPLAPPNVKGWDGGKSWISTSTLLFRYNFANYLLNGTSTSPNAPAALRRVPVDLAKNRSPSSCARNRKNLVADLSQRLFQALGLGTSRPRPSSLT